ncbi:DUF7927 domain-containing protein [Leucobacter sp. HY1908]
MLHQLVNAVTGAGSPGHTQSNHTSAQKARVFAGRLGVGALAVAIAGFGLTMTGLGGAPSAEAVPGQPGVPSDPVVLYLEDFEEGMGNTPVPLINYTGALGNSYTADAQYLSLYACNGAVISFNSSDVQECYDRPGSFGGLQNGPQQAGELRRQAYALGQVAASSTPADNHSLSEYTQYSMPYWTPQYPQASIPHYADSVMFATNGQLPISAQNRFISFSADVVASACNGADQPAMQFFLRDGDGNELDANNGGVINPCGGGSGAKQYFPPAANSDSSMVSEFWGGNFSTSGSHLYTGTSIGIVMKNKTAGGNGNDTSVDNIRILDASPQLDKAFSPTRVPVGETSRLTLTVTNTSELAKKDGWAFTDTLPAGLVLAANPDLDTTCDATVSAPAGGSAITVTKGVLDAGEASCEINIDVTSESPRGAEPSPKIYTNGAGNISGQIGINDPNDATVEFYSTPELTVKKSSDATPSTRIGDEVTYTVTAKNTGTGDYTATSPALVMDDLSHVLDDATYENNAVAATDGASADGVLNFTSPRLSWQGSLAVGETVTLTYTVKVKGGGDRIAKNVAFVGDPENPEEETPECVASGPDKTTGDVSCTEFELPKLTVTKSADKTEGVVAGDVVTYTVTAKNSGPGVFTEDNPAVVTDDLSDVIDNGTYADDATASVAGGTLDYTEPRLSWTGPLAKDGEVTLTYSVTMGVSGNGQVRNVAFVGDGDTPDECDVDSDTCAEVEFPVLKPGLTWQKVDGSDASLSGSEWRLVPLDENGAELNNKEIPVVDCDEADATDCDAAGADVNPAAGELHVKKLMPGAYKLYETKAPIGYKLLEDPIDVTISAAEWDEDGIVDLGTIVNDQQEVPAIPLTGGLGEHAFLLGAGGATLIAATLILIRLRKKRGDFELIS